MGSVTPSPGAFARRAIGVPAVSPRVCLNEYSTPYSSRSVYCPRTCIFPPSIPCHPSGHLDASLAKGSFGANRGLRPRTRTRQLPRVFILPVRSPLRTRTVMCGRDWRLPESSPGGTRPSARRARQLGAKFPFCLPNTSLPYNSVKKKIPSTTRCTKSGSGCTLYFWY